MGHSLTLVLIIPLFSHSSHLSPPGSDPITSFLLHTSQGPLPIQPRHQMCHFTYSLARTFHILSPPHPSYFSSRQLQLCVNPITCCPHFWPKSPNGTGWCHDSVMFSTLGWMCVSAIPLHVMAEASCFPPEVTCTSSLYSVLFPSFFLAWNLFPFFPSVFLVKHRSNPSSNPTHYLRTLLWKMKNGHRMKWID